jgi:hypothetical protein
MAIRFERMSVHVWISPVFRNKLFLRYFDCRNTTALDDASRPCKLARQATKSSKNRRAHNHNTEHLDFGARNYLNSVCNSIRATFRSAAIPTWGVAKDRAVCIRDTRDETLSLLALAWSRRNSWCSSTILESGSTFSREVANSTKGANSGSKPPRSKSIKKIRTGAWPAQNNSSRKSLTVS